MNTLHIKKGDLVVVLSGDDKGTRGKVIAVSPAEGKVMVEGVLSCSLVSLGLCALRMTVGRRALSTGMVGRTVRLGAPDFLSACHF